jgi:hypothetical protein
MPANSTLLASLLLQIQDSQGSGNISLNRQEPQFSLGGSTIGYAEYLALAPGATYQLVANGPLVNFLYVRNATQAPTSSGNQLLDVMGVDYTMNGTTQQAQLVPGGFVMIGNPVITGAGTMTNIVLAIGAGNACVLEYLYVIQP